MVRHAGKARSTVLPISSWITITGNWSFDLACRDGGSLPHRQLDDLAAGACEPLGAGELFKRAGMITRAAVRPPALRFSAAAIKPAIPSVA